MNNDGNKKVATSDDALPDYKDQARPHPRSRSAGVPPPRPPIRNTEYLRKKRSAANAAANGEQGHELQPDDSAALPLAQAVRIPQGPINTDDDDDDDDLIINRNHNAVDTSVVSPIATQVLLNTTRSSTNQSNSTNDGHKNRDGSTVFVLKISRTTCLWSGIFLAVVICGAMIGGVCGTGNCSRTNNNPIATGGSSNATNDTSAGNIDSATTTDIELFLRNISLTNSALEGGGNSNGDETLQQADTMAMEWIVNNFTSSNDVMNITDPTSQQRLRQLFAIATLFYSSNDAMNSSRTSWSTASNWLEPKIHECDWYGIECNDEETDMTTNENGSIRKLQNDFDNGEDPGKIIDDEVIGGSQSNASSPSSPITTTVRPSSPLPMIPTISTPTVAPMSAASTRTIASITLPGNNLVGPMNPNIGLLTDLTKLVMSNNALTGTIPTTLSLCTNMTIFLTSNNKLSGTIPKAIVPSWQRTLRRFDVGSNVLTGTIPTDIGLWNDLRFFVVQNNQLTGTIPNSISNWTKIETAQFDNNGLNGEISDDLCTVANTNEASITVDQDEVVCTCCNIEDDTTTNAPETVVPTTSPPSVSPNLQPLTASPFTPQAAIGTSQPKTPAPTNFPMPGPTNAPGFNPAPTGYPTVTLLPPTSAPNDSAEVASIRRYIQEIAPSGGGTNSTSPTFTAELSAIQWLEENNGGLQLDPSSVVGQFRIGQWYALRTLYYSTNGPSWVVNWESRGFDECSLPGVTCATTQDWSGNVYSIVYSIELYQNRLVGQLPVDLALLSFLKYIDVSSNSLTGTIPEVFVTSTMDMTYFWVYNNMITGTLPASIGTSWPLMLDFDVHNNAIGGTIPETISQWNQWNAHTRIVLSGNMFTGDIPSSICLKFAFVLLSAFDAELAATCVRF